MIFLSQIRRYAEMYAVLYVSLSTYSPVSLSINPPTHPFIQSFFYLSTHPHMSYHSLSLPCSQIPFSLFIHSSTHHLSMYPSTHPSSFTYPPFFCSSIHHIHPPIHPSLPTLPFIKPPSTLTHPSLHSSSTHWPLTHPSHIQPSINPFT